MPAATCPATGRRPPGRRIGPARRRVAVQREIFARLDWLTERYSPALCSFLRRTADAGAPGRAPIGECFSRIRAGSAIPWHLHYRWRPCHGTEPGWESQHGIQPGGRRHYCVLFRYRSILGQHYPGRGWAASAVPLNQAQNQFEVVDSRGTPASILYAGSAPGMINGVFQVNVQLPQGAVLPVTLTWRSGISNPVQIYLQ